MDLRQNGLYLAPRLPHSHEEIESPGIFGIVLLAVLWSESSKGIGTDGFGAAMFWFLTDHFCGSMKCHQALLLHCLCPQGLSHLNAGPLLHALGLPHTSRAAGSNQAPDAGNGHCLKVIWARSPGPSPLPVLAWEQGTLPARLETEPFIRTGWSKGMWLCHILG